MAGSTQAARAKRDRERARQERQQEKRDERVQRKEGRKTRQELLEQGIDPDLVGITPGPQPREDE